MLGAGKRLHLKTVKTINNQLTKIFKGDQVQKIAKKFNFSHGVTKIHIEEEPRLVIQDYCQAKGHSPG